MAAVDPELAPDSVSATGVKYWKSPLLAARANGLTSFAAAVQDNGLAGDLTASNLTATIFAPSESLMPRYNHPPPACA